MKRKDRRTEGIESGRDKTERKGEKEREERE